MALDRVSGADDIRRLLASPDVLAGSVAAVTEAGVEDHCLPLESARTQAAYGWPSAVNHLRHGARLQRRGAAYCGSIRTA